MAGDGSYVVTLNPSCFKNPSAFNWGGRTEFDPGAANIMDRFPDGDGNYWGPVERPRSTPHPDDPDDPSRLAAATSPPPRRRRPAPRS